MSYSRYLTGSSATKVAKWIHTKTFSAYVEILEMVVARHLSKYVMFKIISKWLGEVKDGAETDDEMKEHNLSEEFSSRFYYCCCNLGVPGATKLSITFYLIMNCQEVYAVYTWHPLYCRI